MQAGDVELGQVFIDNHQFAIPMFQRPYVWSADKNWAPLWTDISAAADGVLSELAANEFPEEPPTYFLGAVVLKAPKTHPQRLKGSLLVDGQQRLTTLQVLLASARAVAESVGAESVAGKLSDWIENSKKAIHANFPDDIYKLWPLPQDRDQYLWAVRKPEDTRPAPDETHRLVQARRWFEEAIRAWATADGIAAEDRLDALHAALSTRMKLVRITLDKTDDMQVIFEALNHRGVELSQADLVKNLLFRLVEVQGAHAQAERLLTDYWLPLDGPDWRVTVTTGRITRSRLDLLIGYWLTVQKRDVISVDNLFDDFKDWMLGGERDAVQVIKDIRVAADRYDWLLSDEPDATTKQFVDHLVATKTNTLWPAVLATYLSATITDAQKLKVARTLASYLMRRQVCRSTPKDYNRYFVSLIGTIAAAPDGKAGDALEEALARSAADSRLWPSDLEFLTALSDQNIYGLAKPQIRAFFAGVENHLRDEYAEDQSRVLAINTFLNIEHVMPQSWTANWPLDVPEDADEETIAEATAARSKVINSLGNLTLTSGKLNSAMSNAGWTEKVDYLRPKSTFLITTASILAQPKNSDWTEDRDWTEEWSEANIDQRTKYLAELARTVWPRPKIEPFDLTDDDGEDDEDDDVLDDVALSADAEDAEPSRAPRPKGHFDYNAPEHLCEGACGLVKAGNKFPTQTVDGVLVRLVECRECRDLRLGR